MARNQVPSMLMRTLGPLLVSIWVAAAAADGEVPEKAIIHIPRVTRAPKLNDFVSGTAREAEAVVFGFRQRDPHDGKPASRNTTAYLSYDSNSLYVVFECEADVKTLRARMGKRDTLFGDEMVNVSIDTFHDRRRAYMFFANPLGVQLDGITTEGQDDDFSFDAVWHSEGRILSKGYVVWMAIPFKSLRFSPDSGNNWGIVLTRYLPENKEFSTFPRITKEIEGYVEQFGTLEGIEGVSSGRNIQVVPYGFFSGQSFLDGLRGGHASFHNLNEARGGLDIKTVFRDALTLDATIHPDFSQVESDEPQVTVNQRYEVFFPERRPFFLENAGYFDSPETLFFSRRIVNPQFGARLSGKVGPWAIGFLTADDRAPGDQTESSSSASDQRTSIVVGRVQREIFQQSSIGTFFSVRESPTRSNRVVSFDARLRLTSNWVLTAQATHSDTTTSSGGHAAGIAYFADLARAGSHFSTSTAFRERSPDFEAGLGFIPRVNIRQVRNASVYRWRPRKGSVLHFGPSIYTSATWDFNGLLQDWSIEIPFRAEFRGPYVVEVSRVEAYERYLGHGFRKNATSVFASSDVLRWLGLKASYSQGTSINYFPARGVEPFSAAARDISIGLTLRPARSLRLDETYLFSRLREKSTVFDDHIARFKASYQFSRALSLRAIVDYHGAIPNSSLVDLDRAKRVTADVLLTYLVNPGTALYVGYTNRFENLAEAGAVGASRPPWLSTGHQFFVKMSWLLRP